jgi:hypothetical protein
MEPKSVTRKHPNFLAVRFFAVSVVLSIVCGSIFLFYDSFLSMAAMAGASGPIMVLMIFPVTM